jgi:predicted short-subunit dehydrogenase-like oxidoreductase (DUF2520 family)
LTVVASVVRAIVGQQSYYKKPDHLLQSFVYGLASGATLIKIKINQLSILIILQAKMKISIVGSGNIATYLAITLFKKGVQVHQIISERVARASLLAKEVEAQVVVNLSGLDDEIDALFVAIPDDEISTIPLKSKAVVIHNSGTCTLDKLSRISAHTACLWPVYSITKNNLPTHNDVPIIINANDAHSKIVVSKLAALISTNVTELTDDKKQIAHLAATISNNFSNHLFTLAHDLCIKNNIEFNILIPILELTIQKLKTQSPSANQTGPALRRDSSTIAKHEELLANEKNLQQVYNLITALIQQYYPAT